MASKRKMDDDDDSDINPVYMNKKSKPILFKWIAFDIDDEQSIPQWSPNNMRNIPNPIDDHHCCVDEIDEEMEEETSQIKQYDRTTSKETNGDMDENDEMFDNNLYQCHILQSLLMIMRPGETVANTVKRLAAAVISNKPKQRCKQRKAFLNESPMEDSKKTKLLLEEVTGLIDRFVSNNQMNIYEQTYENLQNQLNQIQTLVQS